MKDEGDRQLELVPQSNQGVPNKLEQFGDVAECERAQRIVLGPRPDSSSGLGFGACAAKVSTPKSGRLAGHVWTSLALLCIWLRSQAIVHGPPTSPLSCCKNSTTSSPWKFWSLLNRMKRPTGAAVEGPETGA